ncbi:MAG: acetyl/propionyl/methylcrotonyl-CoA carboxylase subunit alpha [Kangiellaceae bacterium]|nr:acetyl/propionyl/methylcrotonyl-CoA carboxylase subunit alpha [Kangiellaceae bacterium]
MKNHKINKILIANRGEIACRIIKTAHKMGIECVAVYSDADEFSQHVKLADEAFYIGPSAAKDSYLRADKIIEIAKISNASAVHPGYGFLSENATFAKECAENGIIFIGPPTSAIEAMGSKSEAKNIMSKAKVPLVNGYHGEDQTEALLQSEADKIGYPLLIKATAGGGGKGMRVVKNSNDFITALRSCKRESLSSFGDEKVLIEKYLTKPRHVELQIFADSFGSVIHLFERDCSVQRRHQKVIEEAPAPGLSVETRNKMGSVAIAAAKAIGYQGAGTVEFLYDEDGSFYFMEMNTRLQVEHPVTEMITGLDLVEWQLLVASGGALPLTQQELNISGHAFEARIYAEDPSNDFLPTTGKIDFMEVPLESQFVRVDSGIVAGDSVSIYYDPMIAKLIVWDRDRSAALARLRGALNEFHVAGLTTNIEFLHDLACHPSFSNADLDTHFLDKHGSELNSTSDEITDELLAAATLQVMLEQSQSGQQDSNDQYSPWKQKDGWRLNQDNYHQVEFIYNAIKYPVTAHFRAKNGKGHQSFLIELNDKEYLVNGFISNSNIRMNIDGKKVSISCSIEQNKLILFKNAKAWQLEIGDNSLVDTQDDTQANLTAPMPGTVISVLVNVGDEVIPEQPLIVMEAMKMEHTIRAHKKTRIKEVLYAVGDLVDDGSELISFEED